jgi:hypothetical protein
MVDLGITDVERSVSPNVELVTVLYSWLFHDTRHLTLKGEHKLRVF